MTLTAEGQRARKAEQQRRYSALHPDRRAASTTAYREKNPEKWARIQRSSKMNIKYGITLDEYDAMLDSQNGHCAICPATDPGRKGRSFLYVDHCHETGEVRGLLCGNCNDGLGRFRDDPALLRGAIAYLLDGDDD